MTRIIIPLKTNISLLNVILHPQNILSTNRIKQEIACLECSNANRGEGGGGGGVTSIGSFVTSNKTRKRRVSFRGEPRNAHNANCQDHDNVLIRVSELIVIRVLKYVLFYVERVSKSLCLESFVTIREQGRLIKATSTLLIS